MPWMFTERPLAVKNSLVVICFWEFHRLLWRLVGEYLEAKELASLNSPVSQIAVIASFLLSYLISF